MSDDDLLKIHQPVFLLHPREEFVPITPAAYISACQLWATRKGQRSFLVISNPTSANLANLSFGGADKTLAFQGDAPNGNINAKMTARVVRYADGRTFLVYAVLYARHEPIPGCLSVVQKHDGDLTFAIYDMGLAPRNHEPPHTIWLSQDRLTSYIPSNFTIDEDDRLQIYVALGSHNMYPRAKSTSTWVSYEETLAGGRRYFPDLQVIPRVDDRRFNNAEMGYTLFAGTMGSVPGFAAQRAWTDPLVAITNT